MKSHHEADNVGRLHFEDGIRARLLAAGLNATLAQRAAARAGKWYGASGQELADEVAALAMIAQALKLPHTGQALNVAMEAMGIELELEASRRETRERADAIEKSEGGQA